MPNENAISVRNLTKKYSDFKLNNISFDLPKGKIVGLIGENGSGKTTIIKLMLNDIEKDSGEIFIFGMDHVANMKQIKSELGVIYDTNHYHELFNALELEKIIRKIVPKWEESKYKSLLDTFHLPLNQPISDFSQGMKVKLNFSIVLSSSPKLLILDEATNGLDPMVRRAILDILVDYTGNKEHSVLIASHITSDLERIADHLIILHKGDILLTEEKDVLLNQYGITQLSKEQFNQVDPKDLLFFNKRHQNYEVLVNGKIAFQKKYKLTNVECPSFEDILYFYTKGERKWLD